MSMKGLEDTSGENGGCVPIRHVDVDSREERAVLQNIIRPNQ
jgi:hypothetical protein